MAGGYLLALFVCLNTLAVKGTHVKGLICQDPDTHMLYPINSTWPSVSFCGNYTCRLRQKNLTQTEYAPITNININEIEKKDKMLSSDMETSPSKHAFVVKKKNQPVQHPEFHKEITNKVNDITGARQIEGTDNDRYLTESEIKSITEILHTVKKSDLEAIVEIYNIAQDIYKEVDTNVEEKKIRDTDLNTIKNTETNFNKKMWSKPKNPVSYWYEPLHQDGTKVKSKDLIVESTNFVPTAKSYLHPATYFQGPLTDKDFRKLPYYYPLSNFQRTSSYVQDKAPQNVQINAPNHAKPCRKKFSNIAPTWVNTHTNNAKPELVKPAMVQPMLLPFPFSYVQHYNISTYPASFYYRNYPWAQLDAYNRASQYQPQYFGAYIAQVPQKTVVAHVEEIKPKSDLSNGENKGTMDKGKEDNLPEWQTEQLSAKVLEEVKANIVEDSKLKPLNIVKNIKLEKVGKVIKLDELTRAKRDINNIDNRYIEMEHMQYEPYIEKTTCESNTEVGYFRLGNPQEPYPACCPEKIMLS